MNSKILEYEVEILRLYKPIAELAQDSIVEIAKQLKYIIQQQENSSNEKWKILQEKVYQQLKYISEIHSNYEEYKKSLIDQLQDESFISLNKDRIIELDKNANVIFIIDASDNSVLL